MDLSNPIHLPNVSFRALIKMSLQFQAHSEWAVEEDSHNVSVGGRRRERREGAICLELQVLLHKSSNADNRVDRESKLCTNSPFYFCDPTQTQLGKEARTRYILEIDGQRSLTKPSMAILLSSFNRLSN